MSRCLRSVSPFGPYRPFVLPSVGLFAGNAEGTKLRGAGVDQFVDDAELGELG